LPKIWAKIKRRHTMSDNPTAVHQRPEFPDVKRIILMRKYDAPPSMVFRRIVVELAEEVPPHVAHAFGMGILEDLDFGRYMKVDAVE
jgi:hypothetical protein